MMANKRFRKLLEPGRIGTMELRNRVVMAPMGTNFAADDGRISEQTKCYYEERARGGVGLITIGVAAIDHPRGKVIPRQIGISVDEFLPGLAELTQTIHRHGAKVAIQLHHGGRDSTAELSNGHQPVAPSPVPVPQGEMPRGLTVEEIAQTVERFAQAAERAKKAGFDGVEIHAAHGYLIAQFLSSASNKRQDAYGGELKNRARFLLEIIEAVRGKVGVDYPVWCRLNGREFGIEGGITPLEAQEVACMAEQAGLDAIHVSGYSGHGLDGLYEAPLVYLPGNLVPLAAGIKKRVNIPVIAVGRISPDFGEKVLRHGKSDFIAMARPLIADPGFPNKLASGRLDDIRPCTYCYTCMDQILLGESIRCAVNAAAGKENDPILQPGESPKRVTIVGGGPAGMEAARVAASRGHQVTLYDQGHRLGGSMVFASVLAKENEDLLKYLATQVKKLHVRIKCREDVSPEFVYSTNPNAVIVAVGSSLAARQVRGADRSNVISGAELRQMMVGQDVGKRFVWWMRMVLPVVRPVLRSLKPSTVRWLTHFFMPLGKKVVIIGGDFVACELAEFLAQRGRKVTILDSQKSLGAGVSVSLSWLLMRKLHRSEVKILTGVRVEEITGEGVIIITKKGESQAIGADTILLVESVEPNFHLFQAIQGKVPQVYLAGDCAGLGWIKGAIADGAGIALSL